MNTRMTESTRRAKQRLNGSIQSKVSHGNRLSHQVNNNIAVLEMTNMMITLYNSLVSMNSKIVSDLKDKYLHPFQVVHKYNDLLTK